VSWSDTSGNRWLFGGEGDDAKGNLGSLNDLWKFDPTLGTYGEWTWMGGSSTANQYGVSVPGSREGAVSWSDASGNLWLFGGVGFDSTGTNGYLNDLWKFDPTLGTYGEWTWMGGSSTINQYGVSGPGSREDAVSWSDASGNLWLFGGYGYDANGNLGNLNDLWKFFPSTNQWAWMGGSSTANQYGVYGTLGTAASTNIPGARGSAVSWSDASGNLWLFGGEGFDSTGTEGTLNDLWEYQP
jgi:N-acetylneuraminic acid mutarotase